MTTEQKFNCIFCKDVFDNKEELQIHFRKHGDPKFNSKIQHGNDSVVSKELDQKKTEMVSCDVCSQKFATISKAITHKHKVHPDHDMKYFCPWCGKLFTMKHPYNIHLQNNHENDVQTDDKIFHCDCCDVDFFLTSAMMYHNKFFHRQDSDIPDIGTSKKMKLYQNQEIIQIHYCPFCGEEYENKVNLYKHVSEDHSDENQSPEEVLRCPLCEAIFYHLDAYEIHLSFHTIDDLYSGSNELIAQITDFSLETVPPIIEKVEKEEFDMEAKSQDTDAESSVNAMGIENFLELAMGASEDSNPSKTKRKKHKKSKKPAITLNEFLSMNQDVFGEDLDFQGAEEVPTRVVAKQFKNNKRSANAAASAELEKLKNKGIVVMKVGASKPTKNTPKKAGNKALPNIELKTSSELLTKLINQSNKQIKIVKKVSSVPKNDIEKEKVKAYETSLASDETFTQITNENQNEMKSGTDIKMKEGIYSSPKPSPVQDAFRIPQNIEECSSTTNSINVEPNMYTDMSHKLAFNQDDNDDDITSTNDYSEQNSDDDNTQKRQDNQNVESSNENLSSKNEADQEEFHSEVNEKNKLVYTNNINDIHEDINDIKISGNKNSAQFSGRPIVSSLSSLKHLSHITVKHVNQNKNTPSEIAYNETSQSSIEKPQEESDAEGSSVNISSCTEQQSKQNNLLKTKSFAAKDPNLDALKILNKNITVKSLTPFQKSVNESGSDDDNETYALTDKVNSTIKMNDINENQNITFQKLKVEKNEQTTVNKVANSVITPIKIPQALKKYEPEVKSTATDVDNQQTSSETNSEILKRLPNVVTKPYSPRKIIQPQFINQKHLPLKTIETNHKEQEVIEISDMEESEDETDINLKQPEAQHDPTIDPLKNLSKHITVKSLNHSSVSVHKNIKVEEPDNIYDNNEQDDSFDEVGTSTQMKVCAQKISNRNTAFKNAFKSLGKNITVKSQNSSPPPIFKSEDYDTQYMEGYDDHEYDSDTEIGKVKITEIDEQHSNHDDNSYNSGNCDDVPHNNEPIIESPHDSGNEQDEGDEFDFESQIKVSKVEKCNQEVNANKNTVCLNNLMNISKNITIKSLNSKPIDKQDKPSPSQECLELARPQSKQTPPKLPKQPVKEVPTENSSINKNNKTMAKVVDQSTNDSLDQKVSVNKEVTVKTFQTKTVIQEITTTVTKTIKTVNQTLKQETRTSGQVNIPVMPQKVQGMRPSTSKNLQGVVIRHAAPAAKTSNTVPQIRPSGNVVRPSNQVVPMRPGLNARPRTPRMPTVRPSLPISSPNKQVIGRPLKFSPSAISSAGAKRSNTDDATGPFSCFKKPKESLIPVSDVPTYSGEDAMQVNRTSHSSTSNYMATSKIVKGNSVMTATQMKSEVTSTQHISRTNQVSGIKVKNAQPKPSPVQEKSESSTMKQTTLQAIEKLQKQGLLIKKPRIEENDNSSNNADDNMGYSSADEYYE